MSEDSAPSPNPVKDWFSPGRFALVLALMIVIPFREVLAGNQTFIIRDFGIFSCPAASFLRDSFWRGERPLWNPLSCCGTPFLAQFNTLALYPPSLIYLLLPLTWSLPFFCLLHLFLGGLGMYFLALKWSGSRLGAAVAGTIFAFNGLSLNLLMWPSHIATFAFMPWVVWLASAAWQNGGRMIILAALAAAFQVLAGGPETILFTWLVLLAMAGVQFQKGDILSLVLARRFLTVGLLALALASAQLLPFVDLSLHSNRGSGFGNSAWSMPAHGWANFLAPLFRTSPWQQIVVQKNQYWTSSYYAGIGAVFLAGMALWRQRGWRVWLPGLLLLTSLVLALGDHGYLLPLLQRLLPFVGLFRYPVKFVLLTLFVIPLLAAVAIGHYQHWKPASSRAWWPEFLGGAAILMAIGGILWFARLSPAGDVGWRQTAVNGAERAAILAVFIAGIFGLVARPEWRTVTGAALVGLCWLDVLTHMPWQNPTVDASVYARGLALRDAAFPPQSVAAGGSRVMISPYAARRIYYLSNPDAQEAFLLDRLVFEANCNLLDDVPKVDGFFSLYLRDIDKVLSLFDTNAESHLGQLEDVMAVSQTIAPGKIFDWVRRPSFLPWVSAGQAPVFAGEAETLRALADLDSDFHQNVYLPQEARSVITARREPAARVVTKKFGANNTVLEVETPSAALVFVSQAWYHNWRARVDGRPTMLWRANQAFQAVEALAGRHEIELTYEDTAFRCGLAASILSLVLCATVWPWLAPLHRREAHATFPK